MAPFPQSSLNHWTLRLQERSVAVNQSKKELVRKWLENTALKQSYIEWLLSAYSIDYLCTWFDITDSELEDLT